MHVCVCVSVVQATQKFWQAWKDFEIKHGNEETVREMLRIKRSVQATFNTQVNFMSTQMLAAQTSRDGEENADATGACWRWLCMRVWVYVCGCVRGL